MFDVKAEVQALQGDFRALKDNAKLKAALAKMDLRAEWEALEPQLERAASSVGIVSEEVVSDLKRRFVELKARISAG